MKKKLLTFICALSLCFGTAFGMTACELSDGLLDGDDPQEQGGGKVSVTGVGMSHPSLTMEKGDVFTLSATVAPANASNQAISWVSDNTDVAVVNQYGRVTAISAGTAKITVATQDGNHKAYCMVTVEDSTPVAPSAESVTLNQTQLVMDIGDSQTLVATVEPVDAEVTLEWLSSDDEVATVTQEGEVTAVGYGTAMIIVMTADGELSAECEVIVAVAPDTPDDPNDPTPPPVSVTGVELDEQTLALTVGDTDTLTATVAPADATNRAVTWSSSAEAVVSVENGELTALSAGTAVITVTTADGEFTDSCTVTVSNPVVAVTGVTLSAETLALTVGDTDTLTATVAPADATNKNIVWSSSAEGIVSVVNGTITAHAAGKATISVLTEDGEFTDSCEVTVSAAEVPVTGVTLSADTLSLKVGDTDTLTATVAPATATNKAVTWTCSPAGVVSVVDGAITALSAGTATVTVTTTDGAKTATCTVTVTQPVTGVALNTSSLTLKEDDTATLVATVAPGNATNKAVSWTVAPAGIVSVADGEITALAVGTATVTVTTADGAKTATCTVTVESKKIAVTEVTLNRGDFELEITKMATLVATVLPDDATEPTVTWTSSKPEYATVNGGVITPVALGTTTITATADGKSVSVEVTVIEEKQTEPSVVSVTDVTLDKTADTVKLGQTATVQLTATVAPEKATNKTVAWTTSNANVATVANGLVTVVGKGEATITVTTEDGSYQDSYVITVEKPVTAVTLDKQTHTMRPDGVLQLIATVAPSDATDTDVVWTTSDADVATVDNNGNVTVVSSGTVTVKATSKYDTSKFDECVITIEKPVTSVTLNSYAATLVMGTANTTATLSATVNPSGATHPQITWTVVDENGAISFNEQTGVVTAVANGTATVKATADGVSSAVCTITVKTAVTQIALSPTEVTLSRVADDMSPTKTVALTFNANASADFKGVQWEVIETKDIVDFDEDTLTLIAKGNGMAVLRATSTYNGELVAECTVTVVTPVQSVSLNKTEITLYEGETETLAATISPADTSDKASWKVEGTAVEFADGTVTAKSQGTAVITVTVGEGAGAKTATCTVTVKKAITDITLMENGVAINTAKNLKVTDGVADEFTLTAGLLPVGTDDTELVWTVTGNGVISFNEQTGKVTAVKAGTATITATSAVNSQISKTITVNVEVIVNVTSVTINETLTVEKGNTATLTATVLPTNTTFEQVTWHSSNESVARVGTDGTVTAVAVGTAKITATVGGKTSNECTVTVVIQTTGVTISGSKSTLVLGLDGETTTKLTAATVPADATGDKQVTWKSSNEAVAKVGADGTVTALAVGTTNITATIGGIESSAYAITVEQAATSLTLTASKTEWVIGKDSGVPTLTLTYPAGVSESQKGVTYSVEGTAISVNAQGELTIVGNGTVTIIATYSKNSAVTASVTVTVTTAVTEVTLNKTSASLVIGKTNSETLTVSYNAGATDTYMGVTWSSENGNIVTVENGVITAVANGTAKIIATSTYDGTVKAECTVTVTTAVTSVTMNKATASLVIGGTNSETLTVGYNAGATDTYMGVTWSSENGNIVTVENGVITAVANGTAKIIATSTYDETVKAECTVTVTTAVTDITLSSETLTVTEGGTATLTVGFQPATASNQNYSWSVTDATGAITFDTATGKLTANHKGTATVTVTAAEGGFSKTCSITVNADATKARSVSGTTLVTSGSSDLWALTSGTLTFTKGADVKTASIGADGKYSVQLTDGTWTVTSNVEHHTVTTQITVDGFAVTNKAIEGTYDLVEMNKALGGGASDEKINVTGLSGNYIVTMLFKGNENLTIVASENKGNNGSLEWTGFGLGITGGTWQTGANAHKNPYLQIGMFNTAQVNADNLVVRPTDGGYNAGSTVWTSYETGMKTSDLKTTGIEVMQVVNDGYVTWYFRREGGNWVAASPYSQKFNGTVTGFRIFGNKPCGGNITIADYSYMPIVSSTAGTQVTATVKAKGGASKEWNMAQGTTVFVQNGLGLSAQTLGANGTLTMNLQDGTHKVIHPEYNGAATITVSGGAVTATSTTLNYRIVHTTDVIVDTISYEKLTGTALKFNLPHQDKFVFEMTVKADSSAKTIGETNGGVGFNIVGLDHTYNSAKKENALWQCGLIEMNASTGAPGKYVSRWCDDWSGGSDLTKKDGTAFDLASYKEEGLSVRLVCDNGSYSMYAYKSDSWQKVGNTFTASDGVTYTNGKTVERIEIHHWKTENATSTSIPSKVYIDDMKVAIGTADGTIDF